VGIKSAKMFVGSHEKGGGQKGLRGLKNGWGKTSDSKIGRKLCRERKPEENVEG